MRKALNDNPMVQLGVCAALLLIVGLMLMTRMGGGGGDEQQQEAAAATAVALPPGVSSDGSTVPTGSAPATGAPATTPTGDAPVPPLPASTVTAEALKPGPGLPAPIVNAWKSGDAVVLLIADKSATDDQLVRGSVESLSSRPGIAVFVANAERVSEYSRITQGVNLNRVPALVVIRPRRVSKGVPEATVSYGFRSSQSVVQAVQDALYSGRDDGPYHPG